MSNSEAKTQQQEAKDSLEALVSAIYPFISDPTANVTFRSSDGVDFHVHREILSIVSPMFQSMFALPQNQEQQEQPVVDMQENATSLAYLFSYLDPRISLPHKRKFVSLAGVDTMEKLLYLADKYKILGLRETAMEVLQSPDSEVLEKDPVAAYAVACKYKLEECAQKAARMVVRLPLEDYAPSPFLNIITGSMMNNLTRYHAACRMAARNVKLLHPERYDAVLATAVALKMAKTTFRKDKLVFHQYYGDYLKNEALTRLDELCDPSFLCHTDDLLKSMMLIAQDQNDKSSKISCLYLSMFLKCIAREIENQISQVLRLADHLGVKTTDSLL